MSKKVDFSELQMFANEHKKKKQGKVQTSELTPEQGQETIDTTNLEETPKPKLIAGTPKSPNSDRQKSAINRITLGQLKPVSLIVPEDLRKRAKIYAARNDLKENTVYVKALEEYLSKHEGE
jgi:hypothetical protein